MSQLVVSAYIRSYFAVHFLMSLLLCQWHGAKVKASHPRSKSTTAPCRGYHKGVYPFLNSHLNFTIFLTSLIQAGPRIFFILLERLFCHQCHLLIIYVIAVAALSSLSWTKYFLLKKTKIFQFWFIIFDVASEMISSHFWLCAFQIQPPSRIAFIQRTYVCSK